MKPKLLVDLDGTLSQPATYPEIGKPRLSVIRQIDRLEEKGYEVWIYTCRDWWQEGQISKWCALNGLRVKGVLCGKPLGLVIDDLSINPESDIEAEVERLTEKMNRDWFKDRGPLRCPTCGTWGTYIVRPKVYNEEKDRVLCKCKNCPEGEYWLWTGED